MMNNAYRLFYKATIKSLITRSSTRCTLYIKYKYKRSRARTKYELLGIKIRVFNAKSHCFATLQIEVRKAVMSEVFPSPCLSASVLCVCSEN